MKQHIVNSDLKIFYVKAASFPAGITKAMQALHGKVTDSVKRTIYGISRPEVDGIIAYKAGFEETFEGEGEKLNCETLILRKGNYSAAFVKNYTNRPESISEAFQKILDQPGIDPQGYCVEVYENENDVLCMVRLEDTES